MLKSKGFTLIELLVVIAIIGLLSSTVMANLNTAREKSKDVRRKSDLVQIRTALELYYDKCGTYVVSQNCVGDIYGNSFGYGWFNYDYGNGSISQGLVDNNVVGDKIIDPSNKKTGDNAYMIMVDKKYYTIWATIKNPKPADEDTLNRCHFSCYDNYIEAPAHNYCVSN